MKYLSKSIGTGGSIKKSAQDFVVKEITKTGKTLEIGSSYGAKDLGFEEDSSGKFALFVLQKQDWNTIGALQTVAKRVGRGVRSIGYAGMKDKVATSTQLASIFGVSAQAVMDVRAKDIAINGAWQSKNGVELGDLLGNSFEIMISDAINPAAGQMVLDELKGKMPNYFDSQRFGSRLNNAKIGALLLQNRLEDAAMEFLTGTSNENNQNAVQARQRLLDERDFSQALEYFPGYLKPERSMIYSLSKEPTDFGKALRMLPRGISILFIHALEALIFNYSLDKMIGEGGFDKSTRFCGLDDFGFPNLLQISDKGELALSCLVGYQTKDEELNEYDKELLERLQITKESFKLKSMPELSMKGSYRPLIAPFREGRCEQVGEGALRLCFSLPSGSYATVLAGEVTKQGSLELKQLLGGL